MRLCPIGTIVFPLKNIRPVYASADEATTVLSVWHMMIMGLFSFGLGVSLVGGRSLN